MPRCLSRFSARTLAAQAGQGTIACRWAAARLLAVDSIGGLSRRGGAAGLAT